MAKIDDDDLALARDKPARDMVGRKLFGDDWVEWPNRADVRIIKQYCPGFRVEYRPDLKTQARGDFSRDLVAVIGTTEPCPAGVRTRLERALVRCLRAHAQRETADRWLKRCAPPAQFSHRKARPTQLGPYNRKALLATIAKINQPIAKPGRGRRPGVVDRVKRDMRAQIDEGTLTVAALTSMTEKAIAEQFKCGMSTAHRAKQQVLANSE